MNANIMTGKIEMTETEAEKAGQLETKEYAELMELQKSFPEFKIKVVKKRHKNSVKALTYPEMELRIIKSDREDKEKLLADFRFMTSCDKAKGEKAAAYHEVKSWFDKKFAEPAAEKEQDERTKKMQEILNGAA